MDYFYDGQIRRYLTQFMRVFIGFKYQTGNGEQKYVPVMYGDMTRQVANLINDNSENNMQSVPKISCYITNLELDTSRISDPTFISKIQVREREFDIVNGERVYNQNQGKGYTIERLMPTPYKLSLRADIWTSNTEQKLQLLEQILMLFHPSLELQTTDNYIDWTSLTVLDLTGTTFSSRSIPQGADSEIDICTLDFQTPIWISSPAKVKKLGIIKNIIMNIFTETGDVLDIESLVYNSDAPNTQLRVPVDNFGVYLLKNPVTGYYECSMIDREEVRQSLENFLPAKSLIDWNAVIEIHGSATGTSRIFFTKPNGYEISGTFTVNELDPGRLVVDIDIDTLPENSEPAITAIINPQTFSPIEKFGSISNIPTGTRYLVLEDLGSVDNNDGPDAWKNLAGEDTIIRANSIIEWTGSEWIETFDPDTVEIKYVSNLTTGVQYKWEDSAWLKSFEGEYPLGYWRFDLDA
jgi:hypothetical protein